MTLTPSQLKRLAWVLPAALVALLYGQVWDHLYIDFDDFQYTASNSVMARGLTWEGFKWAFNGSHFANYHPLTWLSHMLDFSLLGNRPGMFAIENAALHALNSTLVAILGAFLFRSKTIGMTLGSVFAAHPKLVEAVAWISQRKTVLATFFFLTALLFYFCFREASDQRKRRSFYVGAIVCYGLSLLSKGMYVTMPAILLLLHVVVDECRFGRRPVHLIPRISPSDIASVIPFALLAVVFSLVSFWAQNEGGAVVEIKEHTLPNRIATALVGIKTYVVHFFYPDGLSVFYPIQSPWPVQQVFGSILAIAAITVLSLVARTRLGVSVFLGWLMFLVMLSPVVGLIQIGSQSSADRYMYGPILGLLVSITSVASWLGRSIPRPMLQSTLRFALGAWVILASLLCYRQVDLWDNSYTLSVASLERVGPHPTLLAIKGTSLIRAQAYSEARDTFREALRLAPQQAVSLSNLVVAEAMLGNTAEAIEVARTALQGLPESINIKINLADLLMTKQLPEESIRVLGEVKEDDPLSDPQRAKVAELRANAERMIANRAGS